MKKLMTFVLVILCVFLLISCGMEISNDLDSQMQYLGAPKIVLNGYNYFANGLEIVSELPEGYSFAGELSDEEKQYAYINGSKYYTQEDVEIIDDFYVLQECGTPTSPAHADNFKRQWAYVKWTRKK